ncbi:MAG: GNAT family N-acetyltransferase [Gammaproteobacteria bacterium]|nr:GNAT family N-acetyltransferase [Gammaproteobacteria bacterium]MDA8024584.1 GNAT family N-acetyltransferase [Gammaproteobacteria bacterium]
MFTEVSTEADIDAVAVLANEIWREHYEPIIGLAQVEYMLEKFQSAAAIAAQIAEEGFCYYLIGADGDGDVGYLGFQREGAVMFLSKLYVKKSARGQGYGARAVEFLRGLAREQGMEKIRLTVNKGNALAIAAYERAGFTRTGELVIDIGGGYVMDDFVFEVGV